MMLDKLLVVQEMAALMASVASFTGLFHNAAFAAAGRNAVYLPLPAVDADDFVTFGRALGVKGASVTIPYKVPLFERADEFRAGRHARR